MGTRRPTIESFSAVGMVGRIRLGSSHLDQNSCKRHSVTLFRCMTLLPASLLFFIPTQNASAQTSIYGSVALVDYVLQNNNTSAAKSDTAGFIGGVFYNFPIQSRLTAGVDARGSFGVGARGGALATVALRIGFVPKRVVLRPYFDLGGGVVTSTFNNGQITGPVDAGLSAQPTRVTSGGVDFGAGLDIRLTDSFDLRAVELGAIAGAAEPGVGSAFLDAGVVYHLHRRPRKS